MIPKVIQKKNVITSSYTHCLPVENSRKGLKMFLYRAQKSVTLKKQRLVMRMRNICQFKDSPHWLLPKKEKVPWSKVSTVLWGLEKLYTPFSTVLVSLGCKNLKTENKNTCVIRHWWQSRRLAEGKGKIKPSSELDSKLEYHVTDVILHTSWRETVAANRLQE